jgi:hypothetical protein
MFHLTKYDTNFQMKFKLSIELLFRIQNQYVITVCKMSVVITVSKISVVNIVCKISVNIFIHYHS